MNNAMIDKNNQLLERDNKQGTGEENSNFSIMNNQEGFRSQMQEQKSQVRTLSSAIDHFVKITGASLLGYSIAMMWLIPPPLTARSLLRLFVQNRLRGPTEFALDTAPGKVHERRSTKRIGKETA